MKVRIAELEVQRKRNWRGGRDMQDHGQRPAPRITTHKPKTPMPRIYHLGGRPALAAVT